MKEDVIVTAFQLVSPHHSVERLEAMSLGFHIFSVLRPFIGIQSIPELHNIGSTSTI